MRRVIHGIRLKVHLMHSLKVRIDGIARHISFPLCFNKALSFEALIAHAEKSFQNHVNPLMPNGAFNICCPRDCVSRHNGGTSGAPLKPLRVDSALRALSTLRGLRGAPEVPPLCRETQSLGQQMHRSALMG